MAQNSLYINTQLESNISLFPSDMNGNMDDHMLSNLRKRREGLSNEYGIIMKIHRLIDYDHGIIDHANFMGAASYRVKYDCLLCAPVTGMELICQVQDIIVGYIVAYSGPIIVSIPTTMINTQKFVISGANVNVIKTNEPLKPNDYLQVRIINVDNKAGEKTIIVVGKLLSVANQEQIDNYHAERNHIHQMNDEEFI